MKRFFTAMMFAVLAGSAAAQSYPSKPIRLIVPYPPGALTDLLARSIGERLATAVKQPVVVRTSRGRNPGRRRVCRRRPPTATRC